MKKGVNMMLLGLLATLGLILAFFIMEMYFYYAIKEEGSLRNYWKRFNSLFILISLALMLSLSLVIFMDLKEFGMMFWMGIILFVYTFTSEMLFYEKQMKFRFKPKAKITVLIIISLAILIICISYSLYTGSIISGGIFSTSSWFTVTFLNILNNENVNALIALMVMGAITLLIAKARGSETFAISGYFLIIILPLMTIFDSLLTDLDQIEQIAPELISAFQNEGLALFVYVIIQFMFYSLLTSLVIGSISYIEWGRDD
jgi:hypothetical protein